jgi:hypothetical protein
MFKRAAIQAEGMVVLERNSRACQTFPRSSLRLSTMSVPRCRSSGVPHRAGGQERQSGRCYGVT